ncbi:MAG: hypothetical protein REI78_13905 [Pedobacter sp.]|nr:hypothetical protein [Pedobacter sp.]MDQ8054124.1 hypothetical protein [Pedobacter sp.]
MSILVKTQNEQEEKVLLAFLNSLKYDYLLGVENMTDIEKSHLDQYNKELHDADQEIQNGDFVLHNDVKQIFKNRRKAI